jgi:hypothetical protein
VERDRICGRRYPLDSGALAADPGDWLVLGRAAQVFWVRAHVVSRSLTPTIGDALRL